MNRFLLSSSSFLSSGIVSRYSQPGTFRSRLSSSPLLLLFLSLLSTWLRALCADSAHCAYMRVLSSDSKALKCCRQWTEVISLSAKHNIQLGGSEPAALLAIQYTTVHAATCHRPCITCCLVLRKNVLL